MPIVQCPECRQPTSIPDSDRTLNVLCPRCTHAFEIPAAVVLDDVEPADPAPGPAEPDFDFHRPAGRGAAPVVSGMAGRLRKEEARDAGKWLLFAGILDGVPIGVAGFWALLAGLESGVAEHSEIGAFVALVYAVV